MPDTRTITLCLDCNTPIPPTGRRGRPAKRCLECRTALIPAPKPTPSPIPGTYTGEPIPPTITSRPFPLIRLPAAPALARPHRKFAGEVVQVEAISEDEFGVRLRGGSLSWFRMSVCEVVQCTGCGGNGAGHQLERAKYDCSVWVCSADGYNMGRIQLEEGDEE